MAVAFLTKRGESGFLDQRMIKPYYQETKLAGEIIDWQYVESILEATIGENMRQLRSFIINACNGSGNMKPAYTLDDVYENFKIGRKESRRGFDEAMFTNLSAYFEIILPEIKQRDFAESITLRKGFNVMDLIDLPEQMQQLVIRATLSYVYENCKNVVTIIPEAHKFIPPSNTPVKPLALKLIREGAAIGNYVWIDTQETTSVDKQLLKQVSIWIMGYQQEKNEVKNIREHLGKRVKEEQINTLKLGHFLALIRQRIYHVYVLPNGVDAGIGKKVARGEMTPEQVRDALTVIKENGDEAVYKAKVEELEDKLSEAKERIKELEGQDVVGLSLDLERERKLVKEAQKAAEQAHEEADRLGDLLETKEKDYEATVNDLKEEIKEVKSETARANRFVKAFEGFIVDTVTPLIPKEPTKPMQPEYRGVSLTMEQPAIEVVRKIPRLLVDMESTRGQIFYLYVTGALEAAQEEAKNKAFSTAEVNRLLQGHGWNKSPRTKHYLDEMLKAGYLEPQPAGRRYDYKVKMPVKEAKERGLITYREEVV